MLSFLTTVTLFASAFAAPVPVVRRQDGFSPSFKDLSKPILAPFYTYFGNKETATLAKAFDDFGMKAATIAFLSAPEGKCELTADLDILEKSNTMSDFIAKGGAIALSFGGNLQDKTILARDHVQQACKDEESLTKLFRDAMDRFKTSNLDIDIEDDGLLKDADAAKRLAGALAKVKSDVPNAFVTYTMGTTDKGMGSGQVAQLKAAKEANLDVDSIALMTMNMVGKGGDNVKASQDAITGGAKQVADSFGISLEDATKKMGMVPSIGVDNNGVVIDLAGAKTLAEFSKKNNLAIQSYWNFNRDFPGGDADKPQDLTASSSPDQKDPAEFFKVMNDVLSQGDAAVGGDVQDVAAAKDVATPEAPDVEVGQKASLPSIGDSIDALSAGIAGVAGVADSASLVAAAGAPGQA